MKWLLTLLTVIIFGTGMAQIVFIPDANFKDALVNSNCVDLDGDEIGDVDADTNNDGEIQVTEAEAVLALVVPLKGITSLQGLESFVNLTLLNCQSNQVTSLDLTPNLALIKLDCRDNDLTSLIVNQNQDIEWLSCETNQLNSLDVSQNTNLIVLDCSENSLNSIDVTQNTSLCSFHCSANQLTTIDISNNPNLLNFSCRSNSLTSLDVSQNTDLQYLICYTNELSQLDVTNNPFLEHIKCYNNPLTSLDLSENHVLNYLWSSNSQLTNLDVSNNSLLSYLYVWQNDLTELDLSQNPELFAIGVHQNNLSSLDLRNGNNGGIFLMWAQENPDLGCINIDNENATYPKCMMPPFKPPAGWCKDEFTIFSENCLLGTKEFTNTLYQLYPNPVTDVFYIKSSVSIENLKVFSLQGALRLESNAGNRMEVSDLQSGLYLVQITSEEGIFTQKFIKR